MLVAASMLIAAAHASAGNWSLGGGVLVSANPYVSMKTNILPLPFISYQGQYVSVYGTMAKARYVLDKQNTIGLLTKLGMQTYRPEDASQADMKLLNERKRLVYMGPYYRFRNAYGQVTAHSAFDVTGNSDGGLELGANYSYPLFFNDRKAYIRPSIGAVWHNNKLANHYYQVSSSESARSGLSAYQPGSFVQPYAGLFSGISLGKKFFWTNVVKVNYIPNAVYNSPMTRSSRLNYSLISGITYEIGDKKSRFNH